MSVEEELADVSPKRDTLLTVGVFDGVHLGHKSLLSELLRQSRESDLLPGVVTFRQHPEDLLSKSKKLPFLTDIETRIELLKKEGIDIVVPLSFTPELAAMNARQFVGLLRKHLKMRGLVVGSDFALGSNRGGDTATLESLGREMGFTVTVIPPLVVDGEIVSSTAIRNAMATGDMPKISRLIGRPFSVRGKVITGSGRGREMGFPTANLDVSPGQALPPDGVYAGLARVNGRVYQAMTNIGRCPTFDGHDHTIESYLVDFRGDLYDKELQLDIVTRLRGEIKFENTGELIKQMDEDVRQGKAILDNMGAESQ